VAFDLVARLKLKDENFSSKMRRVQRATERLNKAVRSTSNSVSNLNSGMSRVSGSVSRLTGTFVGLAAAVGGAVAAQKAFNVTIGEAAKYERSRGLLTAMMGDGKKAKKLIEEIDKMAINSPLLNSQDMMAAASAFLPMTKDINRLKKLYDLSERLFVLNSDEGMFGASYALREFLMGKDATSLAERFNLSRKDLNQFKNLSFDKAVAGLDELLNKMGITRKTIETIGEDTLAKWSQIKERLDKTFRQMGEPSLKVINNFLTGLLNRFDSGDLARFANVGANIVKNIITGLTNNATKIYDWFTALTNSEDFKKRTTLTGKVMFVIEDIYARFTNWLNSEGMTKIQAITETLVGTLANAIEKNSGPIAAAALSVGWKIGSSVAKGIANAISSNPIAKAVLGGAAGAAIGSVIPGVGTLVGGAIGAGAALGKHYLDKGFDKLTGKKPSKHNGGLNYVPYNGYQASLHRGEMVLPRGEAQEYRKNKGRVGDGVTINVQNMHVRQESDIKKIAYELAKLIERKGAMMA
jgi:hypothetical protein